MRKFLIPIAIIFVIVMAKGIARPGCECDDINGCFKWLRKNLDLFRSEKYPYYRVVIAKVISKRKIKLWEHHPIAVCKMESTFCKYYARAKLLKLLEGNDTKSEFDIAYYCFDHVDYYKVGSKYLVVLIDHQTYPRAYRDYAIWPTTVGVFEIKDDKALFYCKKQQLERPLQYVMKQLGIGEKAEKPKKKSGIKDTI